MCGEDEEEDRDIEMGNMKGRKQCLLHVTHCNIYV